jgi:hypothetical protein
MGAEQYQWVLQGGAIAVLLLGFGALMTGRLRTQQEVQAQERRAERAEELNDTLVPAVRSLTAAVEKHTSAVEQLMDMIRERARSP